jgi:hypothetical protein
MGGTCGTHGEKRGVYRIVIGKPEGKRLLGRAKRAGEDNIKVFYHDNFTNFSPHFIHLFVNLRSHLCIIYNLCIVQDQISVSISYCWKMAL